MTGLDTNVLVRYLTQDDPAQAKRANEEITTQTAGGRRCYVGSIVLCELTWVLREAYDQDKHGVIKMLDMMLATRQFAIGDKDLVREALEAFRSGRGDFADYLLGLQHARDGCSETVTFDRDLRGVSGFRVI